MVTNVVSPIAVDLGAVHTGVVSLQEASSAVTSLNASLIVVDPGDLTLGQKKRTQKRHQVRGYKRRKLAKRLLWVILKSYYGVRLELLDITKRMRFEDGVNGLLNRRGFSYYTEEIDTDGLPSILELYNYGFTFLDKDKTLDSQLGDMALRIDECLNAEVFKWDEDSDEYKKRLTYFEGENDKKKGKAFQEIRKKLKDVLVTLQKGVTGHKSRIEYLNDIRADINLFWESTFAPLQQTNLTSESFANLVGHISNLQLKCLRKYFNVPEWKTGDKWDESRMALVFKRYLLGWHPISSEERLNHRNLKDWCASNEGKILACWLEKDPKHSIPPYEDQNNRHPPKCSTLLLDGEVLTRDYPDWPLWVEAMNTQSFLDNAPYVVNQSQNEMEIALRKLQILFDRSSRSDCISLRKIVFEKDEKAIENDIATLRARLGQYTDNFLVCVKRYFKECNAAEKGEWYPEIPNRLLKLCNQNPPHKNKIAHKQLSLLLGQEITEEGLSQLKVYLSTRHEKPLPQDLGKKKAGMCRFTPLIVGADATKEKKRFGQAFKEVYETPLEDKTVSKEVYALRRKIPLAAEVLADFFAKPEEDKHSTLVYRYNNPFIWSQIYDLLEGDIHGFSHTCRHCTNDNHFRSSLFKIDQKGEPIAHAKRLTANSNEPFDGMIAKLIKRIAIDLARIKAKELTAWYQAHFEAYSMARTQVIVPFAVEENAFEFSMDVSDIKKKDDYKSKDKDEIKRNAKLHAERFKKEWEDKDTRIKNDGNGICPYCGKRIESHGQIDHIIPRANSLKSHGTIFNSEPNLIYACAGCNAKKSNNEYTLEHLSSDYLNVVFGTSNVRTISSRIETVFTQIQLRNKHYATAFAEMEREDRQIIRHALFLNDGSNVKKALLAELQQLNKTKVNGTQRWLVKYFSAYLRKKLKADNVPLDVSVIAFRLNADEISQLRSHLAEKYPVFKKPDEQPSFSHIVDATLAFSMWNYAWRLNQGEVITEEDRDALIQSYLPTAFEIRKQSRVSPFDKHPATMKLFKDSIYGDKFLSLILPKSGKLAIGFSLHEKAYCEIPPQKKLTADEIYRLLHPFLQQKAERAPATLEEWIAHLKDGSMICRLYPIHANHAREFLHHVAKNKATSEEILQADLLDNLHYYTLKESVFKQVEALKRDVASKEKKRKETAKKEGRELSEEENITQKREDIQACIDTFIKSDKLILKLGRSLFHTQTLRHPAYALWREILLDGQIDNEVNERDFCRRIAQKYAPRPKSVGRHTHARTGFSLPILKPPSSGAFRIRRGGKEKPVWQVLECNTPKSPSTVGFEVINGMTNFEQEVERPELLTRNIHGVKGRYKTHQSYTRMDKRLILPIPKEMLIDSALLEAQLSPGSKGRPKVWLKIKTDFLSSLATQANVPLHAQIFRSIKLNESLLVAWKNDAALRHFKFRDGKCSILASGAQFTILHGAIESAKLARELYNKQENEASGAL